MPRLYIKKLIPATTYSNGGIKLVTTRKLEYINRGPYNCGYCHADLHISGDCWCINPKTMVWSISVGQPVWENYTPGRYYYLDGIQASGLPDWDGQSILNGYCDDITFTQMLNDKIAPALLLNANATHMGAYVGDFKIDDKTYNVIEFTPASGISPRMASYIDATGGRYTCKGGRLVSYWNRAGKMTGIIDYSNGSDIMPTPQPDHPWSIDNVAVYMMRGSIPDGTGVPQGIENRIAFFAEYGYSAEEVQAAQDIVNLVYDRNKYDKLACELAMRFIAKEAGDGVTIRRQWVADHYPDYDTERLFRKTQDKVNEYLDY